MKRELNMTAHLKMSTGQNVRVLFPTYQWPDINILYTNSNQPTKTAWLFLDASRINLSEVDRSLQTGERLVNRSTNSSQKTRTYHLVDFAVPSDHWEKKEKHSAFTQTLPESWKKLRNMEVTFVFEALGTILKNLLKGLGELEIRRRIETIQTTGFLRSAGILRRILETWRDLLSLRLLWKTTSYSFCEKLKLGKWLYIKKFSDKELLLINRLIFLSC